MVTLWISTSRERKQGREKSHMEIYRKHTWIVKIEISGNHEMRVFNGRL